MKHATWLFGLALAWGAMLPSGKAAIIYIDAEPRTVADSNGNTTINGALVDTAAGTGNVTASGGGGNATDNKWHIRTLSEFNAGSGSTAEAWSTDDAFSAPVTDETSEPLITTINLPTAGIYNLFGFFWNNGNSTVGINGGNWDADFRVGGTGDFLHFDRTNTTLLMPDSGVLNTFDFDVSVKVRNTAATPTTLLMASLGLFAADGPMSVDIHIRGSNAIASVGDQRTQYEGVGYSIIPEPSTFLLISVAWIAFLSHLDRRRRCPSASLSSRGRN